MIIKAQPSDAGCIIDSHYGVYINPMIVALAVQHGWEDPATVSYIVNDEVELADKAEEWLNENVAPEGFRYGWCDGEFFLQSDEWWENEGN